MNRKYSLNTDRHRKNTENDTKIKDKREETKQQRLMVIGGSGIKGKKA